MQTAKGLTLTRSSRLLRYSVSLCRLGVLAFVGTIGLCGGHSSFAAEEDARKDKVVHFLALAEKIVGDDTGNIEEIILEGDHYHGDAVLYVNDVPFIVTNRGGLMTTIDEWIVNGKNRVRLGGDHQVDLTVKLIKCTYMGEDELMGRCKTFAAGIAKPGKPATLKFEAVAPSKPPKFDRLDISKDGQKRMRKEIQTFVDGIKASVTSDKCTELANRSVSGVKHMREVWDGNSDFDLAAYRQNLEKRYSGRKLSEHSRKATVKLVFGQRGVFAYTQRNKSEEPVLLQFEDYERSEEPANPFDDFNEEPENKYYPAIVLVCIGGKWHIWKSCNPF